jgi:hypothetical protein
MKRFVFLFALIVASGMFLMTSCSDNNDTTPTDVTPTINFIGGTGYISADATITAGSEFKVGINAFANATSGAKLVKFTVTRVVNNNPYVVLDSTINVSNFSIEIHTNAQPTATTEAWYYKITDKDTQYKQLSLNITTVSSAGPINAFSMKILGAQQSPTGSSFASIDGSVYTLAQAKANQTKVDWMYYSGDTDFETVAAPDDPHAAQIFTDVNNGLQKWTTKNGTRFKLITDAINWDAITDDQVIVEQAASGVTSTRITKGDGLAVGKFLSFIAASGKKGIIKIDNIVAGKPGEITISVKVQQ